MLRPQYTSIQYQQLINSAPDMDQLTTIMELYEKEKHLFNVFQRMNINVTYLNKQITLTRANLTTTNN